MSRITAYDKFIQQALKYGFSLFGTAKTGQTVSYRKGDDGSVEKGYPRGDIRFIDNGDETITDLASGLMWVKEPGAIGGNFGSAGSPVGMPWITALDDCKNLTYAGYSDWRLPNINELFSIIDHGRNAPAIDETFFPSTVQGRYWSSTAADSLPDAKWDVNFSEGFVAGAWHTDEFYARPVRLGA